MAWYTFINLLILLIEFYIRQGVVTHQFLLGSVLFFSFVNLKTCCSLFKCCKPKTENSNENIEIKITEESPEAVALIDTKKLNAEILETVSKNKSPSAVKKSELKIEGAPVEIKRSPKLREQRKILSVKSEKPLQEDNNRNLTKQPQVPQKTTVKKTNSIPASKVPKATTQRSKSDASDRPANSRNKRNITQDSSPNNSKIPVKNS